MRTTLSIILLFICFSLFGQKTPSIHDIPGITINNKVTNRYSENSDIEIRHLNPTNDIKNNLGVSIDNELFKNGYSLLNTLNPKKIKALDIEKGEIIIDGTTHQGKILITLKQGYKPSIITLTNLISKHLTLDDNPIILQIDNAYINQDFNDYIVDEKYILQITTTTVSTSKNTTINLVNLITKTAENIEKANKPSRIILRCSEYN